MKPRKGMQRTFRYYRLKAERLIDRAGITALLGRAFAKAVRTAYRTTSSLWLVRNLEDHFDPGTPRTSVTVDHLVEDKSRAISWLRTQHRQFPWMFFEKEIDAARANGHIFTVIESDGDIIGYLKIGINDVYIHDFDRVVRFPPDTAFVYDTFVLPAYRGKKVALYALARTIQYLHERNFTRLWCHIEKWNRASLSLFREAGFQEKGTIRFSRFLTLPLFVKDGYKPFPGWKAFLAAS